MEAGSADVQGQPGLGEIPCVKITNKQKNHKQLQKKKKSKRGGKEGKRERRRGDWGRRKRAVKTNHKHRFNHLKATSFMALKIKSESLRFN